MPRLKVAQFAANFLDVDVVPADVEVSADGRRDVIVEVVQPLKQIQFVSYLLQLRILGDLECKQPLAARLTLEFDQQRIESRLEHFDALRDGGH